MTPTVDQDTYRVVEKALAETFPAAALSSVAIVEGGHSGVTLRGTFEDPVATPDVIIKLAPLGAKPIGRHDVLRQAAILEALAEFPSVRVPQILLASAADPNLVVMELVAGDASEPVLDDPQLTAAEVAARARSAAAMLAALHQIPLSVPVLAKEQPATLDDELNRWEKLMDAVPAELRPQAGKLINLLRARVPAPFEPGLIHGDYRIGNTLCKDGEVLGVIDWEIWSVGDQRVDLGWFRLFCDESNFPEASSSAAGLPQADDLQQVYRSAGGVPETDIDWFDALASYKMAAIMGYNLRRHREGRHIDPYQETLVPTIFNLVDRGIDRLS